MAYSSAPATRLTHKLALRRARATLGKWLKKSTLPHDDRLLATIMAAGGSEVLSRSLKAQGHDLTDNFDSVAIFQLLFENLNSALAQGPIEISQSITLYSSLSKLFQGPEYTVLFSQATGLSDLFEVFSISQRKLATANVQKADKNTTMSDQALFSQIYTPPPVVHAMIELCLIEPFLAKAKSVEAIKAISLLDPCCGTGNFLLGAIAAFYRAYEQFDLPSKEICQLIVDNNIIGVDIDARTLVIAKFALTVQLMLLSQDVENYNKHNISCLHNTRDDSEAALGSLSPKWERTAGHPLNRKYSVVLTNPPYLGRKLIDRALKLKLKKNYPECASDLSQIFLWKALDSVQQSGVVGFLSQSSFMHLPSALTLRKRILDQARIDLVIELGDGVFPLLPGSKADSSIIVLTKHKTNAAEPAYYIDLRVNTEGQDKAESKESKKGHLEKLARLKELTKSSKSHGELASSNDLAFNFKRPRALLLVQASDNQALASRADFKQGLATSCNERFLRYAWEVEENNSQYVPYAKGGGSERWWRTISHKVRWGENGAEIKAAVDAAYPYLKGQVHWVVKNENYYFKPGLTFSFVNKHRLSVRRLPAGAIFDVGGSAIFSHEVEQENLLLAYLNSSLVSALAHDLNPTINFQIGDLKRLPVLQFAAPTREKLAALASAAVDLKRALEPLISPQAALLNSTDGGNQTRLSQAGFENHTLKIHSYQSKILSIEQEIDSFVLQAASSHFALDTTDQKELANWVEDRANADTSAAAAVKITSKIFLENQLTQAFARRLWHSSEKLTLKKQIKFSDITNFLQNHTNLEIDESFAQPLIEGDLYQFLMGRFNQVFHEQFGGQPPVLAINGAVQATLPLINATTRPADLYRRLLDK